MASTGIGFRWLDILEKEFDTNFVDLDIYLGELESEDPDVVCNARQKMTALSSCFAQLTHKAQTIFQNSAKVEAELVNLRAELIEAKAKRDCLEQELQTVVLELHSAQLVNRLPGNHTLQKETATTSIPTTLELAEVNRIRKRLQEELEKSPNHRINIKNDDDGYRLNTSLLNTSQLKTESLQLYNENTALRNSILALHSEVYGARLAAKYLDKELAGRIQQLQLLGREMRGDIRDKLWRQLESEILLQRHKTVVRACRRNNGSITTVCQKPDSNDIVPTSAQGIGDTRLVTVKRKHGQGLGISITGGREHGVPILISELEPNGPAALSNQLYIGDAILSVNGIDLKQACHKEAVQVLQQQTGDCVLEVQYIASEDSDSNSLSEDGYNFQYRFFDPEVCDSNDGISLHPLQQNTGAMANTPTAPRTPESNEQSRCTPASHPGVSRITPHLLLSSAAVLRPDVLTDLGVTCVVNATSELPDTPLPDNDISPIAYLRVPLLDRNESDLAQYFDLVADTIDQIREANGVTLVHCVAGVSRSASLCLAYLMKYARMSLRGAYSLVKSLRAQIKPNAGFFRQLVAFEYDLFSNNSVHFVYNEVTKTDIPDVYETDYEHMLIFQKKYKNTCFVGRH